MTIIWFNIIMTIIISPLIIYYYHALLTTIFNKDKEVSIKTINIKCDKFNVACAESCTGGNISAFLTKKSGASNWFRLGMTTYSINEKVIYLDVDETNAESCNCVNNQVAVEMANGLINNGYALNVVTTGYVDANDQSDNAFCHICVISPFGMETFILQDGIPDDRKNDANILSIFATDRISCQYSMTRYAVKMMHTHFVKHRIKFNELFPNDMDAMNHFDKTMNENFIKEIET
jgi:PncC family amidohydrolase